jgi:hypothetical protein
MNKNIRPHLINLIEIVNRIGVPMEGSLFFGDQVMNINIDQIKDRSYIKATELSEFSKNKTDLLEVGFNSGFSALVFLMSSDILKVTSVDLCGYQYTMPCYEYLKTCFGDRIDLIKGQSEEVLPNLLVTNNNFDSYFIDGGHSDIVTNLDFQNILTNCMTGVEICADDYNFPVIKNITQKYIDMGSLEVIHTYEDNVILKAIK